MASALLDDLLFLFAKKYVAGTSIGDAIDRAQHLNQFGVNAEIDFLGEHVSSKKTALKNTSQYLKLIALMKKYGIKNAVSVKLSSIGIEVNEGFCKKNLLRIAGKADESNIFLWIDMESGSLAEKTIKLYKEVFKKYNKTGIAVSAQLRDSFNDAKDLCKNKAVIRLVKGAYKEDSAVAFQNPQDIKDNFIKIMKYLFSECNNFAIATHDLTLIKEAKKLSSKNQFKKFEFQFLKGLNEELEFRLVKEGFNATEYIPFGENWKPYFFRRLKEIWKNFLSNLKGAAGAN